MSPPGAERRIADRRTLASPLLQVLHHSAAMPLSDLLANEIVGLAPGELFVHRNVANVVSPDDVNCTAVLQYAIETLKVEHVIVCGHYGCGGVEAALGERLHGPVQRWIQHVRDVASCHALELERL